MLNLCLIVGGFAIAILAVGALALRLIFLKH